MTIMPMIAGCGGGGSTSGAPSSSPTTAVLTFSSQGTLPAGKSVSGFGAIIELPAGVSVKTDAGGVVDATVVVPSGLLGGAGNAGMGPVTYTAATATAKAKLNFTIASTAPLGVGAGEYATLNLNLSGVTPAVTDFNVTLFKPIDMSFADRPELSSNISLVLH